MNASTQTSGIVFKIQNATTRSDKTSLCRTCRHAHIVRGVNNQAFTRCSAIYDSPANIAFDVAECSEYKDRTKPTLRSMEETAWMLVSNKKTRTVGFVDALEFARQERERENRE